MVDVYTLIGLPLTATTFLIFPVVTPTFPSLSDMEKSKCTEERGGERESEQGRGKKPGGGEEGRAVAGQ